MVDDNFHYMDEDDRYQAGVFATAEEALAAARKRIDDWLLRNHKAGMTADTLYGQYSSFGEDPFIVASPGDPAVAFSAWDYARERVQTICGGETKVAPR
jgi:hypothetical protein